MRPLLNPALHRIWRDGTTLQIGLDPERSIVLTGLDGRTRRFVESLDGTANLAQVYARGQAVGLDDGDAAHVLALLGDALEDAAAASRPLVELSVEDRERLSPDLASASLLAPEPDGGGAAIRRRRAATVLLVGAGRVGASIASLLAAAGVGRIRCEDETPASAADVAPAGLPIEAIGLPRARAAVDMLRRIAPAVAAEPAPGRPPDVVVVASSGPDLLERADGLVRAHIPHLFAEVRETTGLVGPLVIPGRSACRRCVELARTERDPAWPRVVAQLATGYPRTPACDVTLATLVAAQASAQVLALLDSGRVVPPPHLRTPSRSTGGPQVADASCRRGPLPAAVDGTLESSLVSGITRRRSWRPHPACGCGWQGASGVR